MKCKVSGVGGKPFLPTHNRRLSRSTRGTHFQVHGEQAARAQTLTKRKAIGMKDMVSKGEREDMVLLTTKVVPTGEMSR